MTKKKFIKEVNRLSYIIYKSNNIISNSCIDGETLKTKLTYGEMDIILDVIRSKNWDLEYVTKSYEPINSCDFSYNNDDDGFNHWKLKRK